jgi:hypothetical protein
VSGKKKPVGEHKNWTTQQIEQDRGYWKPALGFKCYSIYLKWIPNLYCIDFDEKEIDNSQLYKILKKTNTYYTETKKGYHFYVFIYGIGIYKNQINVGSEEIAIDLLKDNNCWETHNRDVYGNQIANFEWKSLQPYFNLDKMNFTSESVEIISEVMSVPTIEKEKLEKLLLRLDSSRYEYKYWLDVGIICFNNFDGDVTGLRVWNEWSKNGESYDGYKTLCNKWNSFQGDRDFKLSYKRIVRWLIEDNSANEYEIAYANGGEDAVTELMNTKCLFFLGNCIVFNEDGYNQLKINAAKDLFKQYTFKVEKTKFNPFNIWLENFNRKNVDRIVFNPRNNSPDSHFNTWSGFDYEPSGPPNVSKLTDFLQLIREVWANGDLRFYEYALNWFAHILQKPWKKTGICIALQSDQGVGKTLVLSLIGKIIGEKYYYTASSLKNILGDFNGDSEGKLLVNLNECTWGGDKKMEGAFKEFITDDKIVINRKGLNTYTVSNLANTIITTNADWMVAVSRDDRRYNIRRCKDITPQERATIYNSQFYERVAKTDLQELANFLFTRDIENFNPRDYERSELHREQVEKNMDSVELFYQDMLNSEVYCPWEDADFHIETKYERISLYESYKERVKDITYNKPYPTNIFWSRLNKVSKGIVFYYKSHQEPYRGKYRLKTSREEALSFDKKGGGKCL